MNHCVFCQIVARIGESSIVYEDDRVLAFMDIRPMTPGHLLVIPKPHAANLAALDSDLGTQMFAAAHRIAVALRARSRSCEGVNFFLADGVVAGQEVFHVHLHVMPRARGDGFGIHGRFGAPDRLRLDREAAAITALL